MYLKLFFCSLVFLFSINCFSQLQSSNALPSGKGLASGEIYSEEEINKVTEIVRKVEDNNNFIHHLHPDSLSSLPLGLIRQIGNTRYIIAIDSMKFKPQGAYFSAYAAIDFPGTLKKLAFRASNIKFNPSGVVSGEQAKLYLVSNHLIRINQTVSLRLKGDGQNWLEWDCNGFKGLQLKGDFIFNNGVLLPDPSQTFDTAVTATFQIYTSDINDFIATVNITPFTVKGLKDWTFSVTNAIVDMSELRNSTGMYFPPGYNNPNLISPENWRGFALQSLTVKLPPEISKTGNRSAITVNNLLIENMGVTGAIKVSNLFSLSEGSMSGWRFSLEELSVNFVANQLTAGGLKGRLHLPMMDSLQSLSYSASMTRNPVSQEIDYSFIVNPCANIDFKVLSANVTLNNNSNISFIKQGNTFKPTATLNGLIAFNNAKLNSNGGKLAFQDLVITTDAPYITNGIFTLHNINGGLTRSLHYPLSINDITFGVHQGAPVLGFSVTLNLSDQTQNSLSVGTSVFIKGKIETGEVSYQGTHPVTYRITKWKYDKAVLNGFSIDLQTSPYTLAGSVLFKENDPVYGDGFFGTLKVSIKKVIPDPVEMSVGFGSKESYRYFYADAKVPTAFNLGTLPVTITRLIGGLYYHMSPNKTTEPDLISLKNNFTAISGNALSYTPDINTSLGLKAGVSYEFSLNEIPYNGDLMLGINFNSSGGLGIVSLSGDVYSMVSVAQRDKAPVKGKMVMVYDAENRTFDALAQVNINSYQVVAGVGYFKIHFDPSVWYLCIGSPSTPNALNFLNLVNVPSYFMVGNSLEPPM
ncbi:MAG: hypothetical protein K0S12_65, partial [Bacteroidetes bacterium]|nr:hypothetical protein [Bacteroidota bacterium]